MTDQKHTKEPSAAQQLDQLLNECGVKATITAPDEYFAAKLKRDGLLPCPFCGPSTQVCLYQDDWGYWGVACGACGSHCGKRPKGDPDGRQKTIDLWNRRVGESPLDLRRQRDELRNVLNWYATEFLYDMKSFTTASLLQVVGDDPKNIKRIDMNPILHDRGKRARDILAKTKESV